MIDKVTLTFRSKAPTASGAIIVPAFYHGTPALNPLIRGLEEQSYSVYY